MNEKTQQARLLTINYCPTRQEQNKERIPKMKRHSYASLMLSTLIVVFVLLATASYAEEPPPAGAGVGPEVEEVVVPSQSLTASSVGGTVVLNFDDLSGQAPMPATYGGLAWDSRWEHYGWSQPPYNPKSSPQRLYWAIADAPPAQYAFLLFPEGFIFEGAYFSGYGWATVQFEGYDKDGNLIGTSAVLSPSSTPTWLAAGFKGATKVVIASPRTRFWIMDDLTYTKFIEVEIDIKPGSFPNSINPNAGGVIPVAILTTDDFDASTVDPETVALDGEGARRKGKSSKFGSLEDVDGDGDLDLVVQIENVIDWALDATEATLTGETWDGTPIEGTDSVRMVPPEQ